MRPLKSGVGHLNKPLRYDMGNEIEQKITDLEKRIQTEPDSANLHDRLLWLYHDNESLYGDPRRISHILGCVRRFPKEKMCRTPFVHVNPKLSPDGFKKVEAEWLRLLSENPNDVKITLGVANFYCSKDYKASIEVLKKFIEKDPGQAEIWLDLGRYTKNSKERLSYFLEAERRGAIQPNLLVWIAKSAVEAFENDTAKSYADKLLELVNTARAEFGEKLNWKEKGNSLFTKALEATGNRSAARDLIKAISAHAYHKHWGHTVLGLLALRNLDSDAALKHLEEAGSVVGDPRLSSYGPSMDLAKALCNLGKWTQVATYLRACENFWKDERIQIWVSMVESERMPDF
jgi:tetratricopeptide (TPR) repeat protein